MTPTAAPRPGGLDAGERVARAYQQINARQRPEVWIHLRSEDEAQVDAGAVQERLAAGEQLPLAGVTLAVKDNIDVGGLPTTAACPAFAYTPVDDAPSVARLKQAGAIVLGKTNMDQFATGLVGTRTPYGAVRDARDPARISGGSSSGSAVAVALGLADLALGTDTAGSGRVPAAFAGIVGIKPTRGLISLLGVVPACRSFDCVSVFAGSVAHAQTAIATMAGLDSDDPLSRAWPIDAPLRGPANPRIAVARPAQLEPLSDDARRAHDRAADRLRELGAYLVETDIDPFLQAGALLNGGAFVAERYAAVGEFIDAHRDEVDPAVAEIIRAAKTITAEQYVADLERLDRHRLTAAHALHGLDAMMLPTAPCQPTIDQVAADPLHLNRRLGLYASFCNLLDMCAVAVPAGEADGGQFGVTLFAPAFHDRLLADLAGVFAGEPEAPTAPGSPLGLGSENAIDLLVLGAHMSGGPLNGDLVARGARLIGAARTAPSYRMYRLATDPPKSGTVRVASPEKGASLEGELWALPPAALASLLAELPTPMALGSVRLHDGSEVVGFLCEPAALDGAQEITEFGGWRAYLAASGEPE